MQKYKFIFLAEITGEINQLLVEIIENDDSDEEFDGEDEEEDSFADNSEDLCKLKLIKYANYFHFNYFSNNR